MLKPLSKQLMVLHHLLKDKQANRVPKTTSITITKNTNFNSHGNTWLREALLRPSRNSRRILERLTTSQLCSSNTNLSRGVLLQALLKLCRWRTWQCTNASPKLNESVQIAAVITSLSQVSNRRRIVSLATNSLNRWAWLLMRRRSQQLLWASKTTIVFQLPLVTSIKTWGRSLWMPNRPILGLNRAAL